MNLMKNTENDEMIPLKFHLSQNYPNPFKEKTVIKYCLAYKTDVSLTITDSEGEVVERFFQQEQDAGTYEIEFYASHFHFRESGNLLEGKYYFKLEAGNYKSEKVMKLEK
jgi:hypothetical protein